MTSTHVLYGRDGQPPTGAVCSPLNGTVELLRGDEHPEEVEHESCAWTLGSDVSLIPLRPRPEGYPHLQLGAEDLRRYDMVYMAGYPFDLPLDTTGYGPVSAPRVQDDMVASRITAFEGMSGGPYLSSRGHVVGIHRGGILYRPGIAMFVSVYRTRPLLETRVGPIAIEEPVQASDAQFAELMENRLGIGHFSALQNAAVGNRIEIWQTLVQRDPTATERIAIKALPNAPIVASERARFANLLAGPRTFRETLNGILASASETLSACQEDRIRIADGLVMCGSVSQYRPSAWVGDAMQPTSIVMHYTGTSSLTRAIGSFLIEDARHSVHIVIDRDGSFVQLVPLQMSAGHAGNLLWQGARLNSTSIGIEMVNLGKLERGSDGTYRTPTVFGRPGIEVPDNEVQAVTGLNGATYWHRYTGAQVTMARILARRIASHYSIQSVLGHCAAAPDRHLDPGPAFPMVEFGRAVNGQPGVGC